MPACPVHYQFPRLMILCGLLLLTGGARAGDVNKPKTGAAADAPAAASSVEHAPKCYQGCARWGQMCNVDPRGVYKCQRRCEKFGEICD